jgi:hypothetical protein
MWVRRDSDTVDMSRHCQRRAVSGGSDGFWRLIGELGQAGPHRPAPRSGNRADRGRGGSGDCPRSSPRVATCHVITSR